MSPALLLAGLLAAPNPVPAPDVPAPDAAPAPPTGIVLVMADDLGFAQVGYPIGLRDEPHPVLKTPNLNTMAAAGLRLDGFRSAAFTCSPTRASVLTGRTNDRTGVKEHGYPLNPNEITIAQLLKGAGYATGHFGKWHLSGFRGPGVPILGDDPLGPGPFGFETWLSVTNFFDRDPLMSRGGNFEQFAGDSSDIVVREALTFIEEKAERGEPFLAVVWYGSPHSPFVASAEDAAPFTELKGGSRNHHAEIAAIDRSVGALRAGLRGAGVAENTLVWFCSDNGGLGNVTPSAVAPLRGHKGQIYEGGLRVPAIVEWPAAIEPGRVSDALTVTSDILPTLCAATRVAPPDRPLDGVNLLPLLTGAAPEWERPAPLGFRQTGRSAWVDGDLKLLDAAKARRGSPPRWELYNLAADPTESRDLAADRPAEVTRLSRAFGEWSASVDASAAGADYGPDAAPAAARDRQWASSPEYAPFLDAWRDRPEYRRYVR